SDVSKHAATKDDGTPIPVRVYADKVSASSFVGTEGSDSGARDIRGKQLAAIGTQASVAMDIYKRVFGIDYPFDKLDLVADPMGSFYGQAPSSVIYLGFGVFRGEGTVASFGGSDISKFNKDVVAHEVGHQWWGSRVTNSNDRNYWFVESLAELSSALYVEEVFGRKRYLDKVADWRKNVLDAKPWASVQNGYTVWAGEGPTPIANIYNKGPYAFHILRSTFGDDKFFAFLKELGRGLNGKEIVTRDIQAVMERVYQGNMDWFFDQWIRGVGMPQYAVFYTIRPTEDGKWLVQGKIRQRVVAGENNTEMPGVFFRAVAPMTFVAPDGKKFRSSSKVLVQGPETPFQFKLPQEAVEVVFNDEGEILAQDVLYNQSW
ncbi:MAG TPA: M1 family aminopeptidase, partial [Candidatus Polarisedimenticolaceae bacterium]